MRAMTRSRFRWVPIGRALRLACARAEHRSLKRRFDAMRVIKSERDWQRNARILARLSYLEARIELLERS